MAEKRKGLKVKFEEAHLKLNITMPPELDSYLVELGQRTRENGGYKLPKTMIIRGVIRLLREMDPEVEGVRSEDEFLERIRIAATKFGKKKKK